ncbi:thiopeptide-type bacteriocin biosynthesis protein [Pedobacter frigiditerrae]|uniref:lantibiotic dehydratase n=1 Tax=Pedobacter frigiditerrae TaxID=2530452 RepID=UPI002930D9F2|nr:thiopeptide-type bacteriocin biosynthesis protein [Pedobacter frigiditerrae]
MKITPFCKIICRTPAFDINQTLAEVWEELKCKIEESSPDFYELIKVVKAADIAQLDNKARFTIWKYFNRAKYRSTPFGSFASLSMVPLSFYAQELPLLDNKIKTHHWIDWGQKEKYQSNSLQNVNKLLTNSSIYFVAEEIRYIKSSNGSFELATVYALPELNTILLSCKCKTRPDELYELMQHGFNMDRENTMDLLQQLIELQLLHTDLQANITGEDYFSKIHIPCPIKPSNYIIAERPLKGGNFDGKQLKHLPEMIDFFVKNFKAHQNPDLTKFKDSFNKRFENQEVSLAVVMDPEIGIGYGNLAHINNSNTLIADIKAARNLTGHENLAYGKVQQFLLKKLIANKKIDLAEFESESKETAILPNTFSLIFHLYKGKPVLAHTGGCTANSLLGRFTLCNEDIENYGREIANLEINANANVLFFDIAYQAEKKVDNVNRRKQLYPYELPILTWSESDNPLDLNDLLVTIEQQEVVLKSKKLGKRLIPRIASAYNYTRSDLAVYRFLCDIQSQGILTNLSFKLRDFFPGLEHYQRVSFNEIIISPAMWLIPSDITTDISAIKNWLIMKQITSIFTVGHADQSLAFNPRSEEDLEALLSYCKQQKAEIYITEALIDESDFIGDQQGNAYHPQYIVNYHHKERIYEPTPVQLSQVSEVYLPGSEWLYFEIYCHPNKSNYLLLGLFIKSNKTLLKKWFFIRYTDPEPHIRLRLHLKNINTGFKLLSAMQKLVQPELKEGFIIDFKIKTYNKETQRYGIERMTLVEQFFNVDSKCILYLIKYARADEQLIASSINILLPFIAYSFNDIGEQILFVKNLAKSFAIEMDLNSESFKKINTVFNQFKGDLKKSYIHLPVGLLKQQEKLFKKIISNCENDRAKENMLADLIHMHINRLFIIDQRIYETLIYHYLMRILQTKQAILKA